MDPFWAIPPGLRLNILLHLGSPSNAKPLCLVSPAMCKQWRVSRLQISRGFVTSHLPGDLLHDALAIIQFPRLGAIGSDDTVLVMRHLQRWAAHLLQNPFVVCDVEMTEKLVRLCGVLIAYIEDYVDKATSPFPPRVYHDLPDVGSQFSDRRVKFENLRPSERHGFMRAFLDYELLCKIHHPRPNGDYDQTDSSTSQWRISWDWKTLYHYRKQKQEPWMLETLRCVHGYVCSLYGGMFARCADAWVPEHHTDLVFPDSMLFCHEAYANDLDIIYRAHQSLAPTLAIFGVDLTTSLVATGFERGTGLERRARWFRELARMIEIHARWYPDVSIDNVREPKWDCGPQLFRMLRWRVFELTVSGMGYRALRMLQISIYRQRAWVFFDNAELYPHNRDSTEQTPLSHFPSIHEIRDLQEQTLNRCLSVSAERTQRRSRVWQETRLPLHLLRNASSDDEPGVEIKLPEEHCLRHFYYVLKALAVSFWEPGSERRKK